MKCQSNPCEGYVYVDKNDNLKNEFSVIDKFTCPVCTPKIDIPPNTTRAAPVEIVVRYADCEVAFIADNAFVMDPSEDYKSYYGLMWEADAVGIFTDAVMKRLFGNIYANPEGSPALDRLFIDMRKKISRAGVLLREIIKRRRV